MQYDVATQKFTESMHLLEQLMATVRPQLLQDPDIHLALSDHVNAIEAILKLIDARVEPDVEGLLDGISRILNRAELPTPPRDDQGPSYAMDRARQGIDELSDLTAAAQEAARTANLFETADQAFSVADIVPRTVLRESWRNSVSLRVTDTLARAEKVFTAPAAKCAAGFEADILAFARKGISSAAAWARFETDKSEFVDLAGLEVSTDLIDRIAEDLESTVEDLPETNIAALTPQTAELRAAAAKLSRGAATLRRAHHRHVVQHAFAHKGGASTRRLSPARLNDLMSDWLETKTIDPVLAASISHLDLRFRDIRVLSDLTPFSALQSLDLSLNPLVDITALTSAKRLRKLNLSVTYTSNFDILRDISRLEQLAMTGLEISSLRGVEALSELEALYLNRSSIRNWTGLPRATALRAIYLRETNFEDVGLVAQLPRLKTLELRDSKVRDIGPLAQARRLRHLDICNTFVTNIEPLAGLLDLRTVDLSETRVKDISPLIECPSLAHVSIADANVRHGVKELISRGVVVSS